MFKGQKYICFSEQLGGTQTRLQLRSLPSRGPWRKELQGWRVRGPESQAEPSLRHLPGLHALPFHSRRCSNLAL